MTDSIGRLDDDFGKPKNCRRATGRIQQERLVCSLGPVIDFSRGGLKVMAERKLRGEHDVMLPSDDGDLTVRARVVWSHREGIRRHLVGLEFLEVDSKTAARLASIASTHAKVFPLAS